MLRDQDPISPLNGSGHVIAWDGMVEPMLVATDTNHDAPENTSSEKNNLMQAISLYLSQHLHRD